MTLNLPAEHGCTASVAVQAASLASFVEAGDGSQSTPLACPVRDYLFNLHHHRALQGDRLLPNVYLKVASCAAALCANGELPCSLDMACYGACSKWRRRACAKEYEKNTQQCDACPDVAPQLSLASALLNDVPRAFDTSRAACRQPHRSSVK
jgi:hypothetical protein